MIFLILSIVISCILVFALKIAHVKGWSAANVTMTNYVSAAAVSLISCAAQGFMPAFAQVTSADLSTLATVRSVPNTIALAIILGSVTAALFVSNIILLNRNVINNGAGISTLFSRSGFVIGIALSAIVLREPLTILSVIASALTILALAVAGGVGGGTHLTGLAFLIGSLCCSGFADLSNKLFATFGLPDYKANFTAVLFPVACLIYFVIFLRGKRLSGESMKMRREEVILGVCMGIPNAFGNIAQILAFRTVPASIAFPAMAAGNLLLSIALSVLIFKETFEKRKIIAVFITAFSLVVVNLSI